MRIESRDGGRTQNQIPKIFLGYSRISALAAGRIIVAPFFPARDRQADLVGGARLYVWANNTTDLVTMYADQALTVPQPNPAIANSSGQFPAVWIEGGTADDPVGYSVQVTDEDGGSIGNPSTFNNFYPSLDYNQASVALVDGAVADTAENAVLSQQAYADILALASASPALPSVLNRVRFDAAQGLNNTQKIQALANIDGQRTTFMAIDELAFKGVESRITITKVLSSAYGADPTGVLSSSGGLQRILNNLPPNSLAKIEIPSGQWAFSTFTTVPDGVRVLLECAPGALIIGVNDTPIIKYNRPVSGTGTEMWARGGLWIYNGTAKSGGKAIEFKGRSITEHNNAIHISNAEFRYFATAIDLAYTRSTIVDVKALENGTTVRGGPDASFVDVVRLFDQNSNVMCRFDGTGEAAGISNGLNLFMCKGVGIKNRDIWVTLYDLVSIFKCSGDLGGTVGVSGDASVYLEKVTHYEIVSGYFTSRGTSFNYGSPRINRKGAYLEDCWGGEIDKNTFGFNNENVRFQNNTPAGPYFGNVSLTANKFESTTGNAAGLNTSLHIIGVGVETLAATMNRFGPIPDINPAVPRGTFYALNSKNWKMLGNFMADPQYTVPLGTGNMEDINNTWSARVAQ